jgi:hypothetical protein
LVPARRRANVLAGGEFLGHLEKRRRARVNNH